MKIYIVFYSTYGHVYKMAQAVAEGARQVAGAQVELYRVAETIPDAVLEQMGAKQAQQAFAHVPLITPDKLAEADGIVFGTPTRFGNMAGQMRTFLDQTGGLWQKGALIGKPAGVFVSTATQHGGQETTITSFHSTLLHHGMLLVGVPYSEPRLLNTATMSGGSPYGASTIAGGDGSRQPSEDELIIANVLGKRVAEITAKLNK